MRDVRIGDSVRIRGASAVLTEIQGIDGVDYELYKASSSVDPTGFIRVYDSDAHEVVTIHWYPDFNRAKVAYDEAVRVVSG